MTAAAIPLVLAGLPAQTVFVGRERELAELAAALDPEYGSRNGAIVVSSLAGLAGVGKTALAVEAGHQAVTAEWFPGGVLFVDLHCDDPSRGRIGATQALSALLSALGVAGERIPPTQGDRENLYRSLLAEHAAHGRRVLIVADNASSAEQVRPLLPDTDVHRVLITSAHTLSDLDGTRLLDLNVLGRDEAAALLAEVLHERHRHDDRISANPRTAAALSRLCGYLPLALRIIAALMATSPERPIADMVEALSHAGERLRALQRDGSLAVHAAFDLSYQHLDSVHARLYRLLALNPGAQVSAEAAAALADLPVPKTRKILTELCEAHLLQSGTPWGWWRCHDLLRRYARDRADQEEPAADRDGAIDRLLEHYLTTTRATQAHLDPEVVPGDRSTRFPTRPQALDWLDTEHPTLVAAVTLAHQTDRHEYVRDLSLALAGFLALGKHSDDWISTHELARDAARRLGDRHGEGVTLHGLGCAYHQLRQFNDAVIHYQQALRIRRELDDRLAESETLTSLGLTYACVRRYDDAVVCYQEALRIFEDSDDRHGEAFARVSLGLAHGQSRHYDDAVNHLAQALHISRELGDRHGEALALANLANTYFGMWQFDKAITHYRQAFDIRQELADLHVIPRAGYRNVGQVEQARDCWEQALAIFEGLPSKGTAHHLDTVRAARTERPLRRSVGRWATNAWQQIRSRSPSAEPGGSVR